jgi:aromatic-amino-acid transaminase
MGGRIDGMQAPGGTGAVRLAVALAKKAGIKRIWMGTPSWPNHAQIAADVGVEIKGFSHATKQGTVDMDALRFAIAAARRAMPSCSTAAATIPAASIIPMRSGTRSPVW